MSKVKQFQPEGFSEQIFKLRYAFTEEETWSEACQRVARQMALAESPEKQKKYEDKFYEILSSNLFVPGGRIWYNSGRSKPQLLNCFVLSDDLDSKEGWANISKEMIVTSMTGGGCGIDFSDVRPRGAVISGHRGQCPGPVELMELINNNGFPIRAGGHRRVALMFSIDSTHPDVEEFLDAKLEKGKLQLANVSVRFKEMNKFIEAVKNDDEWELSWKGQYKKSIRAKDLWQKIVKNAHASAEPGVLNWELALKESNIHYVEDLTTTNPCFTGNMLIKTESGWKTFKELEDKNVKLYNVNNELVSGSVWSNGFKDIVEVKLSSDEVIKCTHNHKFMLADGTDANAEDLKGKRIRPSFKIRENSDEFTKLGFIQGDGNLGRLKTGAHKGLEINIGTKDADVAELFDLEFNHNVRSYYLNGYNEICKDLKFSSSNLPERPLPRTYKSWTIFQKSSFLRGLYSANGSVIKNGRVALKSTCLQLIEEVKDSLKNDFGIDSYVTTNRPKNIEFNNGSYMCKQSYDLNIGQFQNIVKFANEIAFVHKYKNLELEKIILKKSPLVLSVKNAGKEEVFDFNLQDDTHWGVVSGDADSSGFIAHNCGEICLSPYDCCCLGHLVLPRFVSEGEVDWHLLANTIRKGVRFLDNVLTVNEYPMPEMEEKSHKLRRIGMGTTGLADMLALLGYRYGDSGAKAFIDKLFRFISKAAYESSVMLAVEKGPFEACKPEMHVKSAFMKRMPKKIKSLVEEHGIRNCAILTQAPTGTVSILSGNVSSGIEPMFAPAYERRYWDGDERKAETVFHPLFAKFMEEGKNVEHFVGSHELDVKDHMEVQKIVQKHIDNAVSKTINMSEDYSVEKMEEIWLEYLPYLKGTTFYRENSRGFVDKDGNVQEPPLVAMSLEEAKKQFEVSKDYTEGTESTDCSKGTCEF